MKKSIILVLSLFFILVFVSCTSKDEYKSFKIENINKIVVISIENVY